MSKIHAESREPSVGRGTAPTSGDGDCPGGNPRARRRPTDMEAGAGCRGGTDGRTGIHAGPSHGVLVDGSNTGLGGDQDNGESSDVAQQHCTTPGTTSAVFHRLGYVMADETNTTRQPTPNNNDHIKNKKTLDPNTTGYPNH